MHAYQDIRSPYTQVYTDYAQLQENLRYGTSKECCFADHDTTTVNVVFESRGDTLSDVMDLLVRLHVSVCIYRLILASYCLNVNSFVYSRALVCVHCVWHLNGVIFCVFPLKNSQDGKEYHVFFVNCFFRHARRIICEVYTYPIALVFAQQ